VTQQIPLGFRLRVRNEDDTSDLLSVSTIAGQNPYVSGAPDNGDGAQVDPITGQYTIGSYTIDIIDEIVTEPVLVARENWNYATSAAFNAAWPESYFDNTGTLQPSRTGDFLQLRVGYTPPPFPPDADTGVVATSSLTAPGPNCFDRAYIEHTFTGLTPGQYMVEAVNAAGQVVGTSSAVTLTAASMVATGVGVTAAVAAAAAASGFLGSTLGLLTLAGVGSSVAALTVAATRKPVSPSQ